jgi:mRNA interferase MazF
MSTAPTPRRGEIWQVDFDPSVGAEIRKVRPAVVMTLTGIGRLPLQIVVPLTEWKPQYARASWFVHLPASPSNGLSKDSGADAFQVKSLSNGRFVLRLGVVSDPQLDGIASAIALCVGAP